MQCRRLFFALWPDESVLKNIVSAIDVVARERASDQCWQPVKSENIHLTLAFVGVADQRYHDCLHSSAQEIKAGSFEFDLTNTGNFKKPKIIYLGLDECPQGLSALVSAMNSRFSLCGFEPETRSYTPHVTVFRKVVAINQPIVIKPIRWHARDFYLAESISTDSGVVYKKLYRYPL